MAIEEAIHETNFPGLTFLRRGKVRDLYDLGEHLLIVATDRLSAYDVVMRQAIPSKGKVLTQISNFWFAFTGGIIENHIVETEVEKFPKECRPHAAQLRGRAVVVKKTRPLPIECVVRGYLSGSGWTGYQRTKSVCGVRLPDGLVESAKLPEPIFTPATKAESGHDENISFEEACRIAGEENVSEGRSAALRIYRAAAEYAETKGIIIADTKMEFGVLDGKLILIDELLTPDSSRFWPKDGYQPGRPQSSFDKQFVRDYLVSIHFNKKPPAPNLPEEIIRNTTRLYCEALERITGHTLQ
jgi:phosphoribosylaminoimidazole-succinocarboxamide synthase